MSAVTDRRRRGGREQTGQALALVLGIVVILTLGGTILVQNFEQQSPIVETDLIQHQAYRAVQAGIDEYLYKSNVNSDYIICDSSNQGTGFCPGLTFAQWIPVQGASSNNGPPSWFYFSDPQLSYATGTVSMTVEGASGYPRDYSYQTATITLQPLNNFLLNVLWINYNQIDPAVLNANNPPNCGYYWQVGIENGCSDVDFVNGDNLDGNLYVNDSIFTCGSPQFQTVHTADPNEQFVKDCGGTPDVTGTQGYGSALENIPQDDSQLALVAAGGRLSVRGPHHHRLVGHHHVHRQPRHAYRRAQWRPQRLGVERFDQPGRQHQRLHQHHHPQRRVGGAAQQRRHLRGELSERELVVHRGRCL